MTQEEKDLLLKDICGRLPYGLKAYVRYWSKSDWKYYEKVYTVKSAFPSLNEVHVQSKTGSVDVLLSHTDYVIKPYLFPPESMTEEQMEELCILCDWHDGKNDAKSILVLYQEQFVMNADVIDWLHKNHFDYRGLIEKDLAIDCTILNIY